MICTFLSRVDVARMRQTWLSSSDQGGDIPCCFSEVSHCVLLSALTYALSPTPLHHISHITHHISNITHHFNRYSCPWNSLFSSAFFSIVTMTTVGYGDQVRSNIYIDYVYVLCLLVVLMLAVMFIHDVSVGV